MPRSQFFDLIQKFNQNQNDGQQMILDKRQAHSMSSLLEGLTKVYFEGGGVKI